MWKDTPLQKRGVSTPFFLEKEVYLKPIFIYSFPMGVYIYLRGGGSRLRVVQPMHYTAAVQCLSVRVKCGKNVYLSIFEQFGDSSQGAA